MEVLDRLKELGISYKSVEHSAVYTIEEMEQLDSSIFEGAVICKNLFLRDAKGKRHFLVTLNGEKQVDLKALEKKIQSTRLSFASEERLDKYLGLQKGAVTPLGIVNDVNHEVEVFLDEELKKCSKIAIHPNRNTASILISPQELEKYIQAEGNPFHYITI